MKEKLIICLGYEDCLKATKGKEGVFAVDITDPMQVSGFDEISFSEELKKLGTKEERERANLFVQLYSPQKVSPQFGTIAKGVSIEKTKVEDIQIRFIDGETINVKAVTNRKETVEHFTFYDDTSLLFVAKKDEVKYIKTVK